MSINHTDLLFPRLPSVLIHNTALNIPYPTPYGYTDTNPSIILLHNLLYHRQLRLTIDIQPPLAPIPILPLFLPQILFPPRLMQPPINHNNIQPVMILQNLNILQRIPIHKNTVRIVPWLYLSQFMLAHEKLRDTRCRRDDSFMRREAKQLGEMRKVTRVCTMWCPSEAVVSARLLIFISLTDRKEGGSGNWLTLLATRQCPGDASRALRGLPLRFQFCSLLPLLWSVGSRSVRRLRGC